MIVPKCLGSWILLIVLGTVCCENGWAQPVFEVSFPAAVRSGPATGRLFVMISRTNEPEVRLQGHWINSPMMLAVDVRGLMPGQKARIDVGTLGYPFRSLAELPAGDYFVQAVLNIYTEFHRADGHVIHAHMDQWEGQRFNESPGNLISAVARLHLDAARGYSNELQLTAVIPPVEVPADTPWVERVKIQSKLLSKFWGQPIHLGAVILLPKDYASDTKTRYPVIYAQQGHFTQAAPFGFTTEPVVEKDWDRRERQRAGFETGYEFHRAWQSEGFPRMIAVSLLHPTPFADMSGLVNSVNNGPYADAVMTELIPHVEERFRIIRQPYARVLAGRASGGRDALTLQVRHPEFFGGAWVFQPWAFNFQRYFTLDIYRNDNAFIVPPEQLPEWARSESNWLPVERYLVHTRDGIPIASIRQLSRHDAVLATHAGGEFGTDDAMLSPIGKDGYPRPLWDRSSGRIDREVADYWRDHGDLARYVEKNWPTLGPKLVGKLHLYAGDKDHFQREQGVRLFEEQLKRTRDPHYAGTFGYDALESDYQPMANAELVRTMADHVARNEPSAANRKDLTIYFIDVEGGQATLVVTPERQSLLIDAGWAGEGDGFRPGDPRKARDAKRILAAARDAGITTIDYLLVTHFHGDHIGGVGELSQLLPIRTFIDHGAPNPDAVASSPETKAAFDAYATVRSRGKHIEPRPGDRLPLGDVEAFVVSSAGTTLATPLPNAGAKNELCPARATAPSEPLENPRSTGIVLGYGQFRFLNLGDLSGQPLFDLVCPRSAIGPVDVYLVAHHGGADVADPATFAAFRPRVAIMNNGLKKGGARATYETLHRAPSLEDVWQLHAAAAAADRNFPPEYIANLDESTAHWLKLVAKEDGSFRVFNPRTGLSKSYPVGPEADAQDEHCKCRR